MDTRLWPLVLDRGILHRHDSDHNAQSLDIILPSRSSSSTCIDMLDDRLRLTLSRWRIYWSTKQQSPESIDALYKVVGNSLVGLCSFRT